MNGFSLIELMVALVIIAILASIAYPSYQNHVQRSYRATAQGEMLAYAQTMEQCFTSQNTYVGCDRADGSATGTKRYRIEARNVTIDEYEIIATPLNAQASDLCGTMILRQNGTTTAARHDCWN